MPKTVDLMVSLMPSLMDRQGSAWLAGTKPNVRRVFSAANFPNRNRLL
jgi:hypothetical protein